MLLAILTSSTLFRRIHFREMVVNAKSCGEGVLRCISEVFMECKTKSVRCKMDSDFTTVHVEAITQPPPLLDHLSLDRLRYRL